MSNGMGPHEIISNAEAFGTLVMLGIAFVAMLWMAYNTRWRSSH